MWFIGDHKFRKEKTRGSRTDDVTESGPFTLVHLLIAERCEALCRQANSLHCIISPDLHTLEKGRHFGLSQLHRMKIREGKCQLVNKMHPAVIWFQLLLPRPFCL